MKKRMRFLVSIALFAGLLAGCAGTAEKNSSTDTLAAPDASTLEADDTPATKIYTDKAGREVEVPVNPLRIVTVNMTSESVALGVTPVGAADNFMTGLEDSQKAEIESVGTIGSLNLEKILELEPELIITPINVTDEETIESLSKIAPTVVGPFFGDAFENLRTIGELLGKSEEAEAWISEYEKKAETTTEKLSDVIKEGSTAMVLQLYSKEVTYIYPASTWPTVYTVLGLKLPDAAELGELTTGAQLSLEKLTEYDPDYIILTSGDDESMPELKQELTNNSVWKTLSAVKSNQVYTMGSRLSAGDVLTLDWALDEIVRAVEEVNN